MTRSRNYLDTRGYGSDAKDETFGWALFLGLMIVAAAFGAMPAPSAPARATHEPSHSSVSRPSVSVAIAGERQ